MRQPKLLYLQGLVRPGPSRRCLSRDTGVTRWGQSRKPDNTGSSLRTQAAPGIQAETDDTSCADSDASVRRSRGNLVRSNT